MDQLPDLQSDADVDALMARIRAKLPGAATPGQPSVSPAAPSGNALRDFLAVQEEYASVVHHTITLIAETLEEFQDKEKPAPPARRRDVQVTRRRINGRRRKTR